ncbi:hypothetical protein CTI12_AA434210 [Artemisia annua]|uniref:Knl1 C-terminal RWD domain-containing protein n=1 Tax=Artemisia annua TaxID=35608 RepID=A0A2U1LZG1_ARTAN|nr:hypothetical protein CTI12_AA434210 [Artemisia annua]
MEDEDEEMEDDMDDESGGSRSPFLRLVGSSPSSGGSTFGSATSNDEDNFFGPVSANFIRRDILDREASDGNHDQTMDSTAFSMHFRSIARSDSEVELKTSTGVHLSFEEKTPNQDSNPTHTGSLMLMTQAKKPNHQPSVSTSKLRTSSESNDMSIVGEYRYKYDYGELSPTLDALLAEGNKDLRVIAASKDTILKSPRMVATTKEYGANLMDFSCGEDNNNLEGIITHEMVNEDVAPKHNQLGVANDGSNISSNKEMPLDVLSEAEKHLSSGSSILVTPNAKTTDLVKDAVQRKSSLDFMATSQSNTNQHQPPFVGAVNSLNDKSNHMHFDGVSPSKLPSAATPLHNYSSVFVRTDTPKHSQSVLSMQKSISKLKMLNASPFSADLTAKLEDSASRSVHSPSKVTPNTSLEKNHKASLLSYMDDSGQLSSAVQKKRERASSTTMDDVRLQTPKNAVPVTHMQNVAKLASPLLIPPESALSGEKLQAELLSSADIRNGYEYDKDKFNLPQSFGYSPQKKLKIVNTSEFRSSPLIDAKQFAKHNEPGESVTNASISAIAADKTDALCVETLEIDSSEMSTEEEMVDIREVSLNEARGNLETKENATTVLKDDQHAQIQPMFMESDIARGESRRASPVLEEKTDKQSRQKNLHGEFCQSPSNKQPYDANVDFIPAENVPSPSPHRLSNGAIISEQGRKTIFGVVERTARTQRSPNITKGHVGTKVSSDNEISTIVRTFINPTEMNAMLSRETKELIPQSADKFNLHAIDCLTSIIDQLLKAKTYQLLSDEIKSQKSVDASKYIAHKRAAEMKLLVCKLVHEKAKLWLLNVKRERLLETVESVSSGISEYEELRLIFPPQQSSLVHCKSFSVNMNNLHESQIDSDKVTSMEQTVDHIDRRIANLTKSFHKSCKMKGEPSTHDTIAFVNDYVKKRACCHIVRKDLQHWTVDNFEVGNGCHNVNLNYLDLITQRLTVKTGPVPSISVSHELHKANISKIFSDMDACAAFEFVFYAGMMQKHADATSLAQATQVTGSRLGSLLDVLEEIQHARIEPKNFISARFHTPKAEQLDLELCFFDSTHRRKATVTLDASCLARYCTVSG